MTENDAYVTLIAGVLRDHRDGPADRSGVRVCSCGWRGKAEKGEHPATQVVAAFEDERVALVPLADLYDHADGNPGDGCWALHDRYAATSGSTDS